MASKNLKQRVWASVVTGLLISGMLFACSYAMHSDFLFRPQVAGFYVGILILGVHTATKTGLAVIAIPVNAVIYSVIIFGTAQIFAKKRTQE